MARTKQVALKNVNNKAPNKKLITKNNVKFFNPQTMQLIRSHAPGVGRVNRMFRKPGRGVVVIREIRFYQKSTELLILKLPFKRLVKEIGLRLKNTVRFQESAYLALQDAAEHYLVDVFKDTYDIAINAGRETIMSNDLKLAVKIRDDIVGSKVELLESDEEADEESDEKSDEDL